MSAKMKLDFAGFDELIKKFNRIDAKKIAEEALIEGHKIVTAKAEESTHHYPAGGRYSSGDTLKSLQTQAKITWNGTEASVPVGFSIRKGGMASIFLMYGTPRMRKDQQMYDAFYSSQTEGEVSKIAEEIFRKKLGELE